jgi:hypothetical protein
MVMNRNVFAVAVPVLLLVAVVYVFVRVSSLGRESSEANERLETIVSDLDGSVQALNRKLDSLRILMPGLGEYMTTIQLHAAKLWFAARASNWGLAGYELNKLGETMETVEKLNIFKDSVNVSSAIQSVRLSQLPILKLAITRKNPRSFTTAYDETLSACNGCHRVAGYGFIHIVTPTSEPVTNQQWKTAGQ